MRAAAATGAPAGRSLVADVDHLRKVADTRGREAAATVLRKLAGILRAAVREDDLVARVGRRRLRRDLERARARERAAGRRPAALDDRALPVHVDLGQRRVASA